jgi:cholest-4-en-3-one 26-monooxygenase
VSTLTANPLDPDLYGDAGPESNGLPHELYEHLRNEAPCFWVDLTDPGQIEGTWVVSRYADVRDVASGSGGLFTVAHGSTTHQFAQSNPKTGRPSLLTMEKSDHKRVRSIVQDAFTPRVVRLFEEQLRLRVGVILDEVLPLGTFDFVEEIAQRLPVEAVGDLLGVPPEYQAQALEWTDMLAQPTDPRYAPSPQARVEAANGLWTLALQLAGDGRSRPDEETGQNIVSNLIPHIGTDRLSVSEYQGLFTTIVLGGSETTRNNLSHSLYAMLRRPDLIAALRSPEVDWSQAVEELTRWSSPVIHFRRTATRDVELHGQQIREGDPVAFLMASANFDGDQFQEPLHIDIARYPNKHLSFGWGEHFCLGAHLARLETKIVLQQLLARVSTIEQAASIGYARNATVHGVTRLKITVS